MAATGWWDRHVRRKRGVGGSGLAACCLGSYPAKPLCCLERRRRRRRRWKRRRRAVESLAGGCQGQEQLRPGVGAPPSGCLRGCCSTPPYGDTVWQPQ